MSIVAFRATIPASSTIYIKTVSYFAVSRGTDLGVYTATAAAVWVTLSPLFMPSCCTASFFRLSMLSEEAVLLGTSCGSEGVQFMKTGSSALSIHFKPCSTRSSKYLRFCSSKQTAFGFYCIILQCTKTSKPSNDLHKNRNGLTD